MKVTRLYTGSDGESHFEDLDIPLIDAGDVGSLSTSFPVKGIVFRENGPNYFHDWHNSHQRQYVVILDSEIEIEVGDGTKRRFRGGDVLLVEDTIGRGHRSRSIDGRPRRSLLIPLE